MIRRHEVLGHPVWCLGFLQAVELIRRTGTLFTKPNGESRTAMGDIEPRAFCLHMPTGMPVVKCRCRVPCLFSGCSSPCCSFLSETGLCSALACFTVVLHCPFHHPGVTHEQDPAKADKITKIQRDLDETTEVLVSYRRGSAQSVDAWNADEPL